MFRDLLHALAVAGMIRLACVEMVTRRVLPLTIVLSMVLAVPYEMRAADSKGRYRGYGTGRELCGAVVEADGLVPRATTWAAGFLTAANVFLEDTYAISPSKEGSDWLVAYCRKNPAQPFERALIALVEAMKPVRQREAAPGSVPDLPPTPPVRSKQK
jgi:hypothetical protein